MSIVPQFKDFPFMMYKDNVERRLLTILSDLKDTKTEEELRDLLWHVKYDYPVEEWLSPRKGGGNI